MRERYWQYGILIVNKIFFYCLFYFRIVRQLRFCSVRIRWKSVCTDSMIRIPWYWQGVPCRQETMCGTGRMMTPRMCAASTDAGRFPGGGESAIRRIEIIAPEASAIRTVNDPNKRFNGAGYHNGRSQPDHHSKQCYSNYFMHNPQK